MKSPRQVHVYEVSFFVGPEPAGDVIGGPVSLQLEGPAPPLPQVGEVFDWSDNINGDGLRGTVARASLIHVSRTFGDVTFQTQIACVNSVRRAEAGKAAAASTFNPMLVGVWDNGGSFHIEVDASGDMFALEDPSAYELREAGMTLHFPNTSPIWEFTRLSGDPAGIVGHWERFETESSGKIWREEWTYRADGTYTYHFTYDGAFDSEGIGTYSDTGTQVATRERRARIALPGGNAMVIAQFFGPVVTGTYAVAADEQSWTFTDTAGTVSTYTKVA